MDRLAVLVSDDPSEGDDGLLANALQEAALIAYARCFGTGKRFGLTEENIAKGPPGALAYHRYLKDMRDKHIAHSVNPFEQTAVGVILDPTSSTIQGVAHFHMRHIAFDKEGAEQFARYVRALRTVLSADGQRLSELVQDEARRLPLDELKRHEGLGFYAQDPESASRPR